jgi:hypothetical protein
MALSNRSRQYEQTVREVAERLREVIKDLADADDVGHGATNRWLGASDYPHQIDVSVATADRISLIECKCWGDPVDTEAVLALNSSVADIRAANAGRTVEGIIASQMEADPGALKLAEYFGVLAWTVSEPTDDAATIAFAVRYKEHVVVGMRPLKLTTTLGVIRVKIEDVSPRVGWARLRAATTRSRVREAHESRRT